MAPFLECIPSVRQKISNSILRYSYPGYWPQWLFFTPIIIYTLWLAFKHRGFSALYANPGLSYSGYLDDSKMDLHEMFAEIDRDKVLATGILRREWSQARQIEEVELFLKRERIDFPLIFKPDRGMRSIGVKIINDLAQARAYLVNADFDVLIQMYCDYKNEGSIYFSRDPESDEFQILGTTLKEVQGYVGDGVSRLEELIDRAPLARFVKKDLVFDANLDLDKVLGVGETFVPHIVPCPSTGGLYSSGARYLGPCSAEWVEKMTRGLAYRGVYVGRFDVKFESPDSFRTGQGLKIIELNGAAAELNELYDYRNSPLKMYRLYFRQLRTVFHTGSQIRRLRPDMKVSKLQFFIELAQLSKLKANMAKLDEMAFHPVVEPTQDPAQAS